MIVITVYVEYICCTDACFGHDIDQYTASSRSNSSLMMLNCLKKSN